jgi:lysozyme family protein
MQINYDATMKFVFREEGGFVNDPHDPGGATNMGITIATLSRWLGRRASVADVKALDPRMAEAIYQYDYASPIDFKDLPGGVDCQLMDEAVNAGVGEAHKIWDRVKHLPPSEQVQAVYNARVSYYRTLRNFVRYGKVWVGRAGRCHALACQLVKKPGA